MATSQHLWNRDPVEWLRVCGVPLEPPGATANGTHPAGRAARGGPAGGEGVVAVFGEGSLAASGPVLVTDLQELATNLQEMVTELQALPPKSQELTNSLQALAAELSSASRRMVLAMRRRTLARSVLPYADQVSGPEVWARLEQCVADYESLAAGAVREAALWAWLPAAVLLGGGAGVAARIVHAAGEVSFPGSEVLLALATTAAIWIGAVAYVWDRDEPPPQEIRIARGFLLLGGLVLLVIGAWGVRALGYDPGAIVVGTIIGVMTAPFLLVGLGIHWWIKEDLARYFLRTRNPREHATTVLFGLLVEHDQAPRMLRTPERQEALVWGVEEVARTVQFSRLVKPFSRDANTINWRRDVAARRAEAVREWKKGVLNPEREKGGAVPVEDVCDALLNILDGYWGDLPISEHSRPPLGWREWLQVGFAVLLGVVAYSTLNDIADTLRESNTYGTTLPSLLKTASPFVALYISWFAIPAAAKRALRESSAEMKELRELGGK